MEEHIKNAFLNEIALPVPEYKELFVNPDSIHIKRLLDQDVLKSASFINPVSVFFVTCALKLVNDTYFSLQAPEMNSNESPKVIETGKSTPKKPGIIERPLQKISSSTKVVSRPNTKPVTSTDKSHIHEPEIDLDSLTVIQGSFEVTKTEADITRNRESLKTTSTLKPFMISPASIKVSDNNSGKKGGSNKVVEIRANNTSSESKRGEGTTGKIEKTNKVTSVTNPSTKKGSAVKTTTAKPSTPIVTTTTVKSTTSHIGSTEKMIDTTVDQTKIQNKNSEQIPFNNKPKPGSIGMQVLKDLLKTEIVSESPEQNKTVTSDVPKLDLNLFTNAPVIDEEPWHPIHPNAPKTNESTDGTENKTEPSVEKHSVKKASPPQMTIKDELLMYRNKMPTLESIEQSYGDGSGGFIHYKSFNNPGFTERTVEIEHLGAMDVRPYPLPVNKLTDDPTQFAYDLSDAPTPNTLNVTVNQDKFEYLGGGVIVKRPEMISSTTLEVTAASIEASSSTKRTTTESDEDDLLDEAKVQETETNINETYFGENKLESRAGDSDIEAIGSGEKLSIVNLKDYIMQSKFKPTDKIKAEATTKANMIEINAVTTPTTVTSTADTSSVWEEAPQLFPIGSKWEFVNGTRVTPFENMGMRKVYNETLQALVVENSQLSNMGDFDDMKAQKPNMTDNLPGISSLFDTIASKMGIDQELANKAPPFSTHNKVKVTPAMSTTSTTTVASTTRKTSPTKMTTTTKRPVTTTKRPTTSPKIIYKQTTTKAPSTKRQTTTTTTTTTTKPTTTTTTRAFPSTTERQVPVIVYRTSDVSPTYFDTSSESMFMGEAEVEVVDPNAYEDILKQSQSVPSSTTPVHTTTPRNTPLVTLLPVKSNSGIRNFNREKLKHSPGIMQSAGTSSQERGTNKNFNSRGPIFADNLRESIVKTSMNVDV